MLMSQTGAFLYVADSNSDAISAISTTRLREAKWLSLAPYSGAQLSSRPEGLGLSPDGKTLFVANANYCQCAFDKYTGSMMVGTLSTIDVPRPGLLNMYTDRVARKSHYQVIPAVVEPKRDSASDCDHASAQ